MGWEKAIEMFKDAMSNAALLSLCSPFFCSGHRGGVGNMVITTRRPIVFQKMRNQHLQLSSGGASNDPSHLENYMQRVFPSSV